MNINLPEDKKMILQIMEEKKEYFTFNKEYKGFNISIMEGYSDMNLYYIEKETDINKDDYLKYLSNTQIREELSNGTMKCSLLEKQNPNFWYEKISYGEDLSIEKIIRTENYMISYSETPNKYLDIQTNRENYLTIIKIEKDKLTKIEGLICLDEFETVQEVVVEGLIDYLNKLEVAIKK